MKKEEERQTSDALQKKADAKLKASKDKRIAEQMSQNSADPASNASKSTSMLSASITTSYGRDSPLTVNDDDSGAPATSSSDPTPTPIQKPTNKSSILEPLHASLIAWLEKDSNGAGDSKIEEEKLKTQVAETQRAEAQAENYRLQNKLLRRQLEEADRKRPRED